MIDFTMISVLKLSCLFGLASSDLKTLRGRITPGIYYEESPHAIQTYEKVVPLVFEFKLKADLWNNLPLGYNKFKILPRLSCRSDGRPASTSTSDWLFTCPLFYNLHEYLRLYKNNYTDLHPTMRTLSRQVTFQEPQKFSYSFINFEDCEQLISRTWKGLNGRDVGLGEYRTLVEKCSTLPPYFEEGIPDFGPDSSPTPLFDSMRDNFLSYFFVNASDPGVMVNNLLALQGLHLLQIGAELDRFREAVSSCSSALIPLSFIKASRLERALQDVRAKLAPLKYTLAVPSISKLYKVPIADCLFGTTNLIVQVLLPVVKLETNFNLLKFYYPKFLYNNQQICNVVSSQEDSEYFLYDRSSQSLLPTSCPSNDRDLCHVPDQSQRPFPNKCLLELLKASFPGIRTHCQFRCEKIPQEYRKVLLPRIQRVSSSKFIITLDRITTMLIKCEGQPDELVTPQGYGAVEITLSCSCHIMYHAERFYPRAPCGSTLFVRHVIPEHMINDSLGLPPKLYLQLDEPLEKVNLSLVLEEDTLFNLVDLRGNPTDLMEDNLTLEEESRLTNPSSRGYEGDCFKGHTYLWMFVALQSLAFGVLLGSLYLRVRALSQEWNYGRNNPVSFSVSQITNLDDK